MFRVEYFYEFRVLNKPPLFFFCHPWVCICGNHVSNTWSALAGARPWKQTKHNVTINYVNRKRSHCVCVCWVEITLCHSPDHGTHTDWCLWVLKLNLSSSIRHHKCYATHCTYWSFFLLSVSVSLTLSLFHTFTPLLSQHLLVNHLTPTDLIHLEFWLYL